MKCIVKLILICSLFFSTQLYAENFKIKLFNKGSYSNILNHYKEQPLLLVLWSVTCTACLSEMELIHKLHQQRPELNLIMLAVDGPEFHQEMGQIIKQNKLEEIEHWGFAEDNSPVLRYLIDSRWYGELPRSYFFDSQHNKVGISGVLSEQQYNEKITQFYNNKTR
ncbi:hypothetical protein BMR07_07340 [Methylococcaceae bacterium CS1]|nr:hypothetical protein BMR10_07835 [Methylococcaceae bacterium CS4]TXK97112.1 hypothetical protein BMR11_10795 [Methylococcaceae bacterium CS5]TXL06015.1 hypothetical protein BMR09_08880 [Methylococcaceae bacterium CS3]TXL06340.1 hypothetical protein BMR07_07340 [Methylococcaceae bacterium CS1]TXL11639.1 hypothetical protein BMR08_03665 [Methylococcaceae bacterium CS2]